ncbi:MAG: hypothetical protein NTZ49_05585 [Candidatus Parcubacteria bacterium]|nr:hypothetical protein [Candidatus Parcubacteria bacterium]
MKSIVIYYSRTGNTQYVAEVLVNKLGSGLLPLRDKKNRQGAWNYIWSGFDAIMKKRTKLEEINFDINNFDLIFLGCPNWAANIPPAMRTFLERHYWQDKKVIFFCTQESMGAERVFNNLRLLTKGAEILSEKFFNKVNSNKEASKIQIEDWLAKLSAQIRDF